MAAAGAPDVLLRALSFLAVALLMLSGRSLPDAPARGRHLVLTAASPLLLVYASEARPYALLSALGMALFLLALSGEERGPRLTTAAFVTAAALYTHYLAIFLVGSLAAVALFRRRPRSAAALLLGSLPFAFWVPVFLRQPAEAVAWMREPLSWSAGAFLSALGGVGRVPGPLGGPLPAPLLWVGAGVGVLALAGIAVARTDAAPARDAAMVTGLTLGGAILVSLLRRPVAFPGRTELAVLPIFLWGLAQAGIASRAARLAAASAVVVGTASSLLVLLNPPRSRPTYVEEVARLESLTRPGDLAAVGGAAYLPARREADRGRLAANLLALPSELEAHPGWIPAHALDASERARLSAALHSQPPGAKAFVLLPAALASPEVERIVSDAGLARLRVGDGDWALWVR